MTELTLAPVEADALDRIGLALADPIRRNILVTLLHGPACPSDLAERLSTSRPNLSNHLTCLRGCGLIRADRQGRYLYYELVNDELAQALRALLALGRTLPDCEDQLR
jgi:DNA-binding transcriptional ArsR family regulator